MTPEEREAFYDQEVAPKLLDLAKLCEANGVSLVCDAEWSTESHSRTCTLAEGSSFAICLVEIATRVHGNVDALFMALMKHAETHGHSSAILLRLGVQTKLAEGTIQ